MRSKTRTWLCRKLDSDWRDLELTEVPLPPPAPDEVRVRMRAVAANFPDLLMLKGSYQFKPQLPFAPGMEGCGEVLALGEGAATSGLQVGQRVMIGARCGLMAEEVNVPVQSVQAAPDELSDSQAASFHVPFLTAWVSLVHRAGLVAGETLIVHGATGGVGMAAVQLGKHLGAEVLATGSRADKLAHTRNWGADQTLLLQEQAANLRDGAMEWTQGKGAAVIYDPVGGDVFRQSCRAMAWGGRLLVVGFAGGEIPAVAANIPLIKGFSILGVRAGESCRRDADLAARAATALRALPAAGLKPHICAEIPFERAPEALALLAERRVIGKLTTVLPQ